MLPPYTSRELIIKRLPLIFPEGTPNRQYCIRELSASTIFTMLYIGAIEGTDVYLGPVHVYRMTQEQSELSDDSSRLDYRKKALGRGFNPIGNRWYADNTREPIRDETLREGLVQVGAVTSLPNVPTTSSKPRYALEKEFAELFDPMLSDEEVTEKIVDWQQAHLSKSALMRVSLAGLGSKITSDKVLVTFPNGETRHLAPGLSSVISKAVIENFASKFLEDPIVLWLSESGNKVVSRDDKIASQIGLHIESDKNLPDIILVDLGSKDPILVFVEVVATDGAMTERRQKAIYEITDKGKFNRSQVVFLTAYNDRESPGFKKTIQGLSWNSLAWFVSEPDNIIILKDGTLSISNILEVFRNH